MNTKNRIALVLAPPFGPNLPPLSLINLGGFLISKEQNISLYDLNNQFFNLADDKLKKEWLISSNAHLEENMPRILRENFLKSLERTEIELAQFDIIGFSCYKSNLKTTLDLAHIIKKKKPHMKITLGGPEITRHYFKDKTVFQSEPFNRADLLVVGEGEKPFYDFIQGQAQAKIAYFEEIDTLNVYNPIAGYKLLNLRQYPRRDSVALLLNRGCLRTCRFCSERLLYKKVRTRSIDNIVKEIESHIRENQIQSFIFYDSMLNMNLARLERLCDEIIKKFGKINWEAQMGIRPEMSDRLLEKIAKSGCYNLFIGLESGCDNTLENMRKGFTSMDALRFFKKLKKAKLAFGVSLIVGFPQETEEDAQESLRFLIDNKDYIPKIEQINPFVYYDGTDTHPEDDYLRQEQIAERANRFIDALRKNKFKMTNAFINNLIDKK
ncbi:MAG: radical SAM protein [Candidatus Omnitrophica bacterium]|nr:radical SAM protein [Candidatus Omnitrophota bacterium]